MRRMMLFFVSSSFLTLTVISSASRAQVIGNGDGSGQGGYQGGGYQRNSPGYQPGQPRFTNTADVSVDTTAINSPGAAYPACYDSSQSNVYLCRQDGIVLCLPDSGVSTDLSARAMKDIGCSPSSEDAPPTQAEIESAYMNFDPEKCGKAKADTWEYNAAGKPVDSQCNYAVVLKVGPGAFKVKDIRNVLNRFAKQNNLPEFGGNHWGKNHPDHWRTAYMNTYQDEMSHPAQRPKVPVNLPAKPADVNNPQVQYLPQKPIAPVAVTKNGNCDLTQDYEDETPRAHFCFDSMQCHPKNSDGSRSQNPIYFLVPADFVTQKDKLDDVAFGPKGAGCFPGEAPKFDKREKNDIKAAAAKKLYCYNGFGQLSCPFGVPNDGMPAQCRSFDINNKEVYGAEEYCALVEQCSPSIYLRDITACKSTCQMETCYEAFKKDNLDNVITNQQHHAATATSEFTLGDVRDRSTAIVTAMEKLKTDVQNSAVGRASAAKGENAFNCYLNSGYFKHIVACRKQAEQSTQDGGEVQCADPTTTKCDPGANSISLDMLEDVMKKFSKTTPRVELSSYELAHWNNITDPAHSGIAWRMGDMGGFSLKTGNQADDDKIGKDIGQLTLLLEGMTRPGFGRSQKNLISAIDDSMQLVPNGHGGNKAVITFTAPEGNNAGLGMAAADSINHCVKSMREGVDARVISNQWEEFQTIINSRNSCAGVQDGPAAQTLPGKPAYQPPADGATPKKKHRAN